MGPWDIGTTNRKPKRRRDFRRLDRSSLAAKVIGPSLLAVVTVLGRRTWGGTVFTARKPHSYTLPRSVSHRPNRPRIFRKSEAYSWRMLALTR